MLNIVLFEPEIPQNTGNIMRTCAGTGTRLHLIKPLGFSLNEKAIKRSGVNYIEKCEYYVYENFDDFICKNSEGTFFYLTRYGKKVYTDYNYIDIKNDIYLIFGKESTGIPKKVLKDNIDRTFRIPMNANIRALNLSNCVALVLFEVLRQLDFPNLSKVEIIKGSNYLENEIE